MPRHTLPFPTGVSMMFGPPTRIMGVVNVTPDSFSDGGLFYDTQAAVTQGLRLVAEGADILDIGGESTRPGHLPVDAAAELFRILPVIAGLKRAGVPLSVDTMKAGVARVAIEAGATMVNDVWGLAHDPDLGRVIAEAGVPVVLMANKEGAGPSPDITAEVIDQLRRALDRADAAGIAPDRIVLDPGIGFGKTPEQNLTVLAELPRIRGALDFPLLVGASRKSFIGRLYPSTPQERLPGTLAAHTLAIAGGASIVRVHDVGPAVQAARVADAVVAAARKDERKDMAR